MKSVSWSRPRSLVALVLLSLPAFVSAQSSPTLAYERQGDTFRVSTGSVTTWLVPGEIVVQQDSPERAGLSSVVRLDLGCGNEPVAPRGLGAASATSYRIRNGVVANALFHSVRYDAVQPGVDVLVHSAQGAFEYDIELAPHVAVRDLRIRCDGADELAIIADELVITTGVGELRQRIPRTWEVDEHGQRHELPCRFRLIGDDSFGFTVSGRTKGRALVIDPTLTYASYLGGVECDFIHDMHVGGNGTVWVTGVTHSPDFPTTSGTMQRQSSQDAFVARMAPGGSSLVWATYLGGSHDDEGCAIVVDDQGRPWIAGWTKSNDFPAAGTLQAFGGGSDAFVARLAADGSAVEFATYIGGSGDDEAFGLVRDAAGRVLVCGRTGSTDLPTTAGVAQAVAGGGDDGFVARIGTGGSPAFQWVSYLGGSNDDYVRAVDVNGNDQPYVTGYTTSDDLGVPGSGAIPTRDDEDAFVIALDGNGSTIVAGSYIGGNGDDEGFAIDFGSGGDVVVAGIAASNVFPTTANAFDSTRVHREGFVMRLSADCSQIYYSTLLGGNGDDRLFDMIVSPDDSVWVTGDTSSSDFWLTSDALDATNHGGRDPFVSQIRADGTLAFSTMWGGPADEHGYAIGMDDLFGVYVAGHARPFFPTTAGAFDVTWNGGSGDGFVLRLQTPYCPAGAATAQSIPLVGCNHPYDPVLTVTPPVLGAPFQIDVDSQFPGIPCWVVGSFHPFQPFVHPSGCTFWVDLYTPGNLFTFLETLTDANGDAYLSFDMPVVPALLPLSLCMQTRICVPGGPVGPLAPLPDFFSNGVELSFGCPQ